jgi:hypothetical protein
MHDGINIEEQSIVDAHYTYFRSITEDALPFDAKNAETRTAGRPTGSAEAGSLRSTPPLDLRAKRVGRIRRQF